MSHDGVTHQEKLDHFWKLLDDTKICMITTQDQEYLRSRPMFAYIDKDNDRICFLTSDKSHKTLEVMNEAEVNLGFQDTDKHSYVSVSGRVSLSKDKQLIDDLWSAGAEAWLSHERSEDSTGNVIAIVVHPQIAEFWDNDKNIVSSALEFAKGVVSDKQPNMGENRKVGFGR
jgi:general stress protein 26